MTIRSGGLQFLMLVLGQSALTTKAYIKVNSFYFLYLEIIKFLYKSKIIYSTKKLRKSQKTMEQKNIKTNNYSFFLLFV